ncbi:MAG TPA: hypothetical protein VK576_09190, partial [Thermoleophilia bacterium]|nr:hypothetical protein [Thermoleophilia bacterium]
MNAHALPAGERQVTHGEPPEGERGVRGLVWVTWRQHRAALAGVAGLLGAFALAMVVQGVGMHAAFNDLGLGGARSFDTPRLASLAQTFENEYLSFGLYVPRVLMFLPLFVGAFLGAPLLAREYETGTFRFAWTQGVGRTRWIVAKLTLLGLALAIVSLAFSLLFGWWYQPFARLMGHQ